MNNIKLLRVKNNMKQADIADMLSISKLAYSQKESGKTEFKQSELLILSDFYKVTIDELVR